MNIIFNLINTGLANNGGSSTIIKSANILNKLGHNIILLDSMNSNYTWDKIDVPHIIIKNENDLNKYYCDIIIATGYKSIYSTINFKNVKLKCHYIRGWEIWVMNEKKIYNDILNNNIIKIVNSIGLQNKLKQFNINSHIIYPGNDIELYYPLDIRKNNKKIIIGGLYNKKHFKTKGCDIIFEIIKILKDRLNNNIELYMFGNDEIPNDYKFLIDKYLKQPSIKDKNIFFNSIDIWLSTSELEGLHIVPQEYLLTEGCIIGNNSELSGTKDYLINNKTGIIVDNNIDQYLNKIYYLINNKNIRLELGINGRKKIIEIGDRINNMKKMINLFNNYIIK